MMRRPTMRRLAAEFVRSFVQRTAPSSFGLTVIVHDAEPSPGTWTHAVHSTLPNSAQTRALLAEVLADSVIAEGGTLENAAELVSADYLEAVRPKGAGRS